jgi:hypothetical protein
MDSRRAAAYHGPMRAAPVWSAALLVLLGAGGSACHLLLPLSRNNQAPDSSVPVDAPRADAAARDAPAVDRRLAKPKDRAPEGPVADATAPEKDLVATKDVARDIKPAPDIKPTLDKPCVPSCAGKCRGASDGCKGSCPLNDCAGCCDANNLCLPGTSETNCGNDGAPCVPCAGYCDTALKRCIGCVPKCANLVCAGTPDGCGGRCLVNYCSGCCTDDYACEGGTTPNACGMFGARCKDCSTVPVAATCLNLTCQPCTKDCSNACAGGPDGCGGKCAASTCQGCCVPWLALCLPGTSTLACGSAGSNCSVCANGQSCGNGACQ